MFAWFDNVPYNNEFDRKLQIQLGSKFKWVFDIVFIASCLVYRKGELMTVFVSSILLFICPEKSAQILLI